MHLQRAKTDLVFLRQNNFYRIVSWSNGGDLKILTNDFKALKWNAISNWSCGLSKVPLGHIDILLNQVVQKFFKWIFQPSVYWSVELTHAIYVQQIAIKL